MNFLSILLLIIMIIIIIVCIIQIFILSSSIKEDNEIIIGLYQNNIWESFISEAKKGKITLKFQSTNEKGTYNWFSYGPYDVIVWPDSYSSVHLNTPSFDNCVLSSFNEEKSKELAQILINSIKK